MGRMNKVSWNENPEAWSKDNNDFIPIASLNCAGLRVHYEDIKADDKLQKADVIHLVETSLKKDDDIEEFILEGYTKTFINIDNGKGIATYYDDTKISLIHEVKRDKFQIIKLKNNDLDIINIYRSQTGNSVELLEDLRDLIEPNRRTIITGDFNICFMENFSNRLIQGLLVMGFTQLVHEPTHIRGRYIDQVFYMDQYDRFEPVIDRYSPYYSDHDAILITLHQSGHKPD